MQCPCNRRTWRGWQAGLQAERVLAPAVPNTTPPATAPKSPAPAVAELSPPLEYLTSTPFAPSRAAAAASELWTSWRIAFTFAASSLLRSLAFFRRSRVSEASLDAEDEDEDGLGLGLADESSSSSGCAVSESHHAYRQVGAAGVW